MNSSKSFDIVIGQEAQREAKQLTKKYPSFKADFTALVASLKTNPQQGEPLGRDCYKIRLAVSSKKKGKRGGARTITCVKILDEQVVILSVYDKAEAETISDSELLQRLKNADLL